MQDSVLLLFENAADASVILEINAVLLVLVVMNTAVVIKSPSI